MAEKRCFGLGQFAGMSMSYPIVAIAVGYYLIFVWHAIVVVRAMGSQYVAWKGRIPNAMAVARGQMGYLCWDPLCFAH